MVSAMILLAQMDTLGDFLYQVRGLIAFVCVLGILWIALLALTLQRNTERRRREKLGLEPLPNMWVSFYRWITQQGTGTAKQVRAPLATPSSAAFDPSLTPDLDLLTGDFAAPAPSPAASTPQPSFAASAPPAPPVTAASPVAPEVSASSLAETFAFDDIPPARSTAPIPASPPPPDAVELLRVFRDLVEGGLVLQIDGKRLNSANDLFMANLSTRFTKVVRELALMVRAVKENSNDAASAAPPVRAADLPSDLAELLRVFRDLSEGTLILEIDGQRFHSIEDLIAAGLSRRFTKVVRDLALMVRTVQELEAAGPPPAPQPTPQPAPQAAAPQAAPQARAAEPQEPRPAQQPPRPITKPMIPLPDDEMPSMSPGSMFRQMTRAAMGQKSDAPEESSAPILSIAEQIDEVLQSRLGQLPEFRNRKIKVQPSLSGGVQIRVDDRYFEGVGDVTDDAVRALLQDVVREWEERYG